MNNTNKSTIFIKNRNIIYDIIYENDLSVQYWYTEVANILNEIINNCNEDMSECTNEEIYNNLKNKVEEAMIDKYYINN